MNTFTQKHFKLPPMCLKGWGKDWGITSFRDRRGDILSIYSTSFKKPLYKGLTGFLVLKLFRPKRQNCINSPNVSILAKADLLANNIRHWNA